MYFYHNCRNQVRLAQWLQLRYQVICMKIITKLIWEWTSTYHERNNNWKHCRLITISTINQTKIQHDFHDMSTSNALWIMYCFVTELHILTNRLMPTVIGKSAFSSTAKFQALTFRAWKNEEHFWKLNFPSRLKT